MKHRTHLTHLHIRFRHRKLWLKVKYPKAYKVLSSFLLVCLMVSAASAYFLFTKDTHTGTTYAEQFNLQYAAYSLNGEVVSISNNKVYLKVSTVQSKNGINTLVYENRTIEWNPDTKVSRIEVTANTYKTTPAQISDIRQGDNIVVYSTTNSGEKLVVANKIELIP